MDVAVERTPGRRDVYARAFEALRYAQNCSCNGDGPGERLALDHCADLVVDLLSDFSAPDAEGKPMSRSESGRMGRAASPYDAVSKARGTERARVEARGGEPAELPADATVTRLAGPSAEDAPGREPEVRGHIPKSPANAKRFRLFEAAGDAWNCVAVGTATELANSYGVTASQVYALAGKRGSTSRDGRWRAEAVS